MSKKYVIDIINKNPSYILKEFLKISATANKNTQNGIE